MPSSAAVVVRSVPIKLRFKRSIPTPAALIQARDALLQNTAAQLADLDRWIAASTQAPASYADYVCASVIEHRSLTRAATVLNAAGLRTPRGLLFTHTQLSRWIDDPQGGAPDPQLLDLARRIQFGAGCALDRARRHATELERTHAEGRS